MNLIEIVVSLIGLPIALAVLWMTWPLMVTGLFIVALAGHYPAMAYILFAFGMFAEGLWIKAMKRYG